MAGAILSGLQAIANKAAVKDFAELGPETLTGFIAKARLDYDLPYIAISNIGDLNAPNVSRVYYEPSPHPRRVDSTGALVTLFPMQVEAIDAESFVLRRGQARQTFRGLPNPAESVLIWNFGKA